MNALSRWLLAGAICVLASPSAAQDTGDEPPADAEGVTATPPEGLDGAAAPDAVSPDPVAEVMETEPSPSVGDADVGGGALAPPAAPDSDTPAPVSVADADLEAASEAPTPTPDVLETLAGLLESVEAVAFADVYLAQHWTLPQGFSGDHAAQLSHRAFDVMGGLALSFAGFDLTAHFGDFAATTSIRFGSSMPRLMGPTSGLPDGLQFLKQLYVSWSLVPELRVDFGLFDTPFGAEVAESWRNPTYTRGALYNVMQPFYHSGLRAVWTPTERLTVTALAVNGWNTFIDNNDGKSVGLQLAYTEGPLFLAAGYLGGPETADDGRWRHFADVIVRLTGDFAELTLNGDVIAEDVGEPQHRITWGAMATARFTLASTVWLALRGEYLGDPTAGSSLGTATMTLDVRASPNVVVRLDNRIDAASDMRFVDNVMQPASFVASSILGLVVHTD